jgi:uncharacterized PurR-regulated membrane protein YhhQ (DUF165 family)
MNGEKAALAMVAVGEVFQICASMLPSPTTMMQGGGDPERIAQLKRNRLQAAVMSTLLLTGVAYFVGTDGDHGQAWTVWIFGMATLALFYYETERALKKAEAGAGSSGGF